MLFFKKVISKIINIDVKKCISITIQKKTFYLESQIHRRNGTNLNCDRHKKAFNNYKIIHISDLHLGSFNDVEKLEEAIEMINSENPDLVVFTGDLVNNYSYI